MSEDNAVSAPQKVNIVSVPRLDPETHLGDQKTIIFAGEPLLGAGAYGEVYPCVLKETLKNGERNYNRAAVKYIEVDMRSASPERALQVETEIKNWMHLSESEDKHQNVLQILAGKTARTNDGRVLGWAVTELMDMTLEQLIFKDRGFIETCTYKSLLQIAEKICKGLAHLHENRFIHYDLKPSNVLVSKNAQGELEIKLSDFGLTKKLEEGRSSMTETCRGTRLYMAPEIMALVHRKNKNKDYKMSNAVDIYSLGVLLWELFNGKKPSDFQSVSKDTGKSIKWPNAIGADDIWCRAPDEICDLIESCLSYNPEDDSGKGHGRPSASEVQERISQIHQMYEETWASKRPPTYLQAAKIDKAELERVKGDKEKLVKENKEIKSQLEKAKADGGELEKRMRELAMNHGAERGDWETIQGLLDKEQLNLTAMSGDNSSPLHWAAGCGNTVLVQKLLEEGVEVDVKDKDGHTPFCCAVFHGHLDVAKVLLERGAHVDVVNSKGFSPLQTAAACGHKKAEKFLTDHGANEHLKNEDVDTFRDVAPEHSPEGAVQLLV